MLNTIIFDGEGVIIDTEGLWDLGQEEFLRRRGLAYDRARIKPMLAGASLVEGVKAMQRELGFGGDAEELAAERLEIVSELIAKEVAFIDGFLDFFQSVRGEFKTCVATAMEPELLKSVEKKLKLSDLFGDRVFTVADVDGDSKPSPALFLHAARELRSRPSECVVIEDAPHGIVAAHRAGMKCIALTTTFDRFSLPAADQVVDEFSEIDLSRLVTEASKT